MLWNYFSFTKYDLYAKKLKYCLNQGFLNWVPSPFSLNYMVRGAAAPWGLYDKGALTKKVWETHALHYPTKNDSRVSPTHTNDVATLLTQAKKKLLDSISINIHIDKGKQN